MAVVGVPTVSGIQQAAGDYAVGAVAGLSMTIFKQVFGNNIIGSLIAAAVAGSVVKGPRGQMVATMAGFHALTDMSLGAKAAPADTGPDIL